MTTSPGMCEATSPVDVIRADRCSGAGFVCPWTRSGHTTPQRRLRKSETGRRGRNFIADTSSELPRCVSSRTLPREQLGLIFKHLTRSRRELALVKPSFGFTFVEPIYTPPLVQDQFFARPKSQEIVNFSSFVEKPTFLDASSLPKGSLHARIGAIPQE